jgi:LruC domain-containing protein
MKKSLMNLSAVCVSLFLLSSCEMGHDVDQLAQVEQESSNSLSIPYGFDFSTHQKVTININDTNEYAKYDVYAYSDKTGDVTSESDVLKKLIFSGITRNGELKQTINLPKIYNKVYIRRNEEPSFSSTSLNIDNQEVVYNYVQAKGSSKSNLQKSLTDTDGDGVLDQDDAFPNDPEKAFKLFTPSENSYGTIAFEDLWPSTGDYDFNDVAFRYQATVVLNADNLAVGFDFKYRITSNNTTGINGIGFELEGLLPSQIESVSGQVLTRNFINLNANGTEANQGNAVIILTDDVWNLPHDTRFEKPDTKISNAIGYEEMTVSVNFTNPITTTDMGIAPFNPFLIVNIDERYKEFMTEANDPRYPKGLVRNFEVHLPNMNTTSLGIPLNGIKDHVNNYVADNGYPWAIHVIDNFSVPRHGVKITDAYNYFKAWAESGGTEFQDWYLN